MRIPRRSRLFVSALVGALAAALSVTVVTPTPASAHGNVTGPASRNYGCWERWGSKFQDPAMQTQDPMCWQAWQDNPNAMWNWNGLYREGLAGNHQGGIPDGTLCSGGLAEGGRYRSMDTVGNWTAANVGNNFNVRLLDNARHGADYIDVYVSRAGFNPTTTALKWSDLTRVSQIGNTPAAQWPEQRADGVAINVPVSVSGRSGRAIVYTIWKASHSDQSYYFCSDVNFGGTTTPTTPPTTPPTTGPTTPPTTGPTTPPASGSCSASYALSSQWGGGYQGEITVTAGSSAIKGWTVSLSYPGTPAIQQAWNATLSTSGNTVQATNVGYNGALGAGGKATFGFLGSGTAVAPTVSCSATV
jgi:chitin-binding protein